MIVLFIAIVFLSAETGYSANGPLKLRPNLMGDKDNKDRLSSAKKFVSGETTDRENVENMLRKYDMILSEKDFKDLVAVLTGKEEKCHVNPTLLKPLQKLYFETKIPLVRQKIDEITSFIGRYFYKVKDIETSRYEVPDNVESVANELIKGFVEKRSQGALIYDVGCSYGEMTMDLGKLLKGFPVNIVGTDRYMDIFILKDKNYSMAYVFEPSGEIICVVESNGRAFDPAKYMDQQEKTNRIKETFAILRKELKPAETDQVHSEGFLLEYTRYLHPEALNFKEGDRVYFLQHDLFDKFPFPADIIRVFNVLKLPPPFTLFDAEYTNKAVINLGRNLKDGGILVIGIAYRDSYGRYKIEQTVYERMGDDLVEKTCIKHILDKETDSYKEYARERGSASYKLSSIGESHKSDPLSSLPMPGMLDIGSNMTPPYINPGADKHKTAPARNSFDDLIDNLKVDSNIIDIPDNFSFTLYTGEGRRCSILDKLKEENLFNLSVTQRIKLWDNLLLLRRLKIRFFDEEPSDVTDVQSRAEALLAILANSRNFACRVGEFIEDGMPIPEDLRRKTIELYMEEQKSIDATKMGTVKPDNEKYDRNGNPLSFDGITTVSNLKESDNFTKLVQSIIGNRDDPAEDKESFPRLLSINRWQRDSLGEKIIGTVPIGSEHVTLYDGVCKADWKDKYEEQLNEETKTEIERKKDEILQKDPKKTEEEARKEATYVIVQRRIIDTLKNFQSNKIPRFKPIGIAAFPPGSNNKSLLIINVAPAEAEDLAAVTKVQEAIRDATGIRNYGAFMGHITIGYFINPVAGDALEKLKQYISELDAYIKVHSDKYIFELPSIEVSRFSNMESFPTVENGSFGWKYQGGLLAESIAKLLNDSI